MYEFSNLAIHNLSKCHIHLLFIIIKDLEVKIARSEIKDIKSTLSGTFANEMIPNSHWITQTYRFVFAEKSFQLLRTFKYMHYVFRLVALKKIFLLLNVLTFHFVQKTRNELEQDVSSKSVQSSKYSAIPLNVANTTFKSSQRKCLTTQGFGFGITPKQFENL